MKLALNILTLSIFTAILIAPKTQAQITANPGDTNTVVNQSGDTFTISGGTQVDKNVFHSLQKFGLNENQIADFVTNPGTQNILGRITGGDASVINGLIKVTGSNANLYLMNPAGIIFGSGASLNIPGSFTATTANGIGFGDKWFNAVGENNYADLIGEPDSFVFSMSQPGAIANFGNLALDSGETLSLIGGKVINTGTLSSQGGNINIVAIPGKKLVRVTQKGSLLSLGLPTSTENTLNPVNLNPVSLPQLLTGGNLNNATGVTVENGIIKLTGSNVEIPNDSGTAIVSRKVDVSGKIGGKVSILGEKVGVVDANINASGENSGGTVLIGGDYKGKGTVPNAERTFISRDSVIKADAENTGNGGKVIAWADNTTAFYGNISARGGKTSGDGGFVEVSGKENLAFDGFVDVGADFGKGGELLLDPATVEIGTDDDDDSQLNDQEILSTDPGEIFKISASTIEDALGKGNVAIEATDKIDVNSNIDKSNGGNLTLDAPSINMVGENIDDSFKIRVGGDLNLSTKNLTGRSILSSSNGNVSFGNYTGSSLKVEAKGSIEGGNINVKDPETFGTNDPPEIAILIENSSLILRAGVTDLSNESPSSPANIKLGNIDIAAVDISTTNGSVITGAINAGSVDISSKGDIYTERIQTPYFAGVSVIENDVNINFQGYLGNINLTSSFGKISVDSIDASSMITLDDSNRANVTVKAYDIFKARNSFNALLVGSTDAGDTNSFSAPTSISASGNVSIEHGSKSFTVGVELEKDTNGDIIYRTSDDKRVFKIKRVSDNPDSFRFVPVSFVFEDGTVVNNSEVSIKTIREFNEDDISENTSYTRGIILRTGGENERLYGSFPDTEISVVTVPKPQPPTPPEPIKPPQPPETTTPPESIKPPTLPETIKPPTSPEPIKPPTSPEPSEPSEPSKPQQIKETEAQTAQRQLNRDDKNKICSSENSKVALNSEENTRNGSSKNNPCKTANDKNNILKVIPDNRFNSNSALPTSLLELGEKNDD